jgi:hypothetical protein
VKSTTTITIIPGHHTASATTNPCALHSPPCLPFELRPEDNVVVDLMDTPMPSTGRTVYTDMPYDLTTRCGFPVLKETE